VTRVRMGLVGFGAAGTHHIECVRRLGFVDVVAVASSNLASTREKARRYGIPTVHLSYENLAADPSVEVIHNTTPNYLHAPVIRAALRHRKHIVSDKPLATSASEARELLNEARTAGVVHAVTFHYRGSPLVREARLRIARADAGPVHFVQGAYLQDWLLEDTDYSWRLDPVQSGPSCTVADIGSHWCDLAEHVTGLRIEAVLANLDTVVKVRKKHLSPAKKAAVAQPDSLDAVKIETEDLASALVRLNNGAMGCFSVGQVCAGHKNDLSLEVSCQNTSFRWQHGWHEQLWIGYRHRPNEVLPRERAGSRQDETGSIESHGDGSDTSSDDLFHVLSEIYGRIVHRQSAGESAIVATFDDGYRINCIIDALLKSHADGNVWTRVNS